ncbi:MAG: hypothetical protein KAR51_03935, partial [Candidatus Aenigmarchaeota archaeon]|nr:hypothetical protein [Candidatus Aenigmarchaeota archaeon]
GGKGVRNLLVTEKTGNVVAVRSVLDTDEIMLTSAAGKLIRTPIGAIRVIGRSTQGVRIMKLDDGDKVMAVSIIPEKDDEDEVEGEDSEDSSDKETDASKDNDTSKGIVDSDEGEADSDTDEVKDDSEGEDTASDNPEEDTQEDDNPEESKDTQ